MGEKKNKKENKAQKKKKKKKKEEEKKRIKKERKCWQNQIKHPSPRVYLTLKEVIFLKATINYFIHLFFFVNVHFKTFSFWNSISY